MFKEKNGADNMWWIVKHNPDDSLKIVEVVLKDK